MPQTLRSHASTRGVEQVVASLRSRALAARGRPRVTVSYSTPYAVYVHENLEMYHPRGGQAKFLEQPLRENRPLLAQVVRETLRAGGSVLDAELAAANLLLDLSRPLVPVDTGRLRDSGAVAIGDAGT